MTDGIIQKTLRMYNVNVHEDVIEDMIKELIKKIELEILSIYEQEPYITAHTLKLIQKNLIGDNQE